MNYNFYLTTPHWRSTRQTRLAASQWLDGQHVLCQGCKMFIWWGCIDVHHRTYANLGAETNRDLAVLCRGCHAFFHGHPTPPWWNERRKVKDFCKWSRREIMATAREMRFIADGDAERALDFALRQHVPIVQKDEIYPNVKWMGDVLSSLLDWYEKWPEPMPVA